MLELALIPKMDKTVPINIKIFIFIIKTPHKNFIYSYYNFYQLSLVYVIAFLGQLFIHSPQIMQLLRLLDAFLLLIIMELIGHFLAHMPQPIHLS